MLHTIFPPLPKFGLLETQKPLYSLYIPIKKASPNSGKAFFTISKKY
jgi:hypothetical protein